MNPMQIMGMLQNSGNPMAAIQQMATSNPQMQQAIKMCQNGDPRQIAMNLAREKGVSEDQLRQLASQFGISL